ncbi:hypothetical protein DCCM_0010 [Desulfocucumis palustris]|uniref:Uncharacterized protein n=1 Tax=Desulfocucumis palustris TaxID=1898651 RepID=A0A2L2XC78_9FIRM|nr:hypothetical protein DCCM_0010 [Desulfocucumis palustris]
MKFATVISNKIIPPLRRIFSASFPKTFIFLHYLINTVCACFAASGFAVT